MLTRAGLVLAALLQSTVALAAITFIGEGSIPGTTVDQSGLKGDPRGWRHAGEPGRRSRLRDHLQRDRRLLPRHSRPRPGRRNDVVRRSHLHHPDIGHEDIDASDVPGFQAQDFDRLSRKCFARGR